MKSTVSHGICLAAVFAFGGVAFGQAGQQPAPAQTQPGARSSADQAVTVTGCVIREADYRKANNAGGAGVAGTGVGAGNEFVLANASSASRSDAPTGTTGSASSATIAYELTGPGEGQAGQYVGKRVEIVGRIKAGETNAAGQPTGGATAGAPPSGVDAASKDLKLRELEVTSVKEAEGSCPAAK